MYLLTPRQILVIARPKLNGLGEHFGVSVDNRVVHYTADRGFEQVSIEEFAQGRDVRIDRLVSPGLHGEVVRRLRQIAANPRPYHAMDWNCETFANWLSGTPSVSRQVVAALGMAVLILGVVCSG